MVVAVTGARGQAGAAAGRACRLDGDGCWEGGARLDGRRAASIGCTALLLLLLRAGLAQVVSAQLQLDEKVLTLVLLSRLSPAVIVRHDVGVALHGSQSLHLRKPHVLVCHADGGLARFFDRVLLAGHAVRDAVHGAEVAVAQHVLLLVVPRQPVLLGGQHVRAAAAAAVGRVEQVRVIIARCEVGVADDRGPMPEEAVAGGVAAAATGVHGRLAGPQT
mmetsp:Transcript_6240/g.16560  ORF Transcript_6240/g.16560 Transcript_6240/m.16560 type:complete len:219 (-) Transcript_6240:635-1291(-)